MNIAAFSYRFFPVGQGLFSCGSLFSPEPHPSHDWLRQIDRRWQGAWSWQGNCPWHWQSETFIDRHYPWKRSLFFNGARFTPGSEKEPWPRTRLNWVYDCGTSSSQSLVNEGIHDLQRWCFRGSPIDILTISHFDRDHISGICRLIESKKVRLLLLPYIPLAKRILIAFEEKITPGDELMGFFTNPVDYLADRGGPGIEEILFIPPSPPNGPDFPDDEAGSFEGDGPLPLRFERQPPPDSEESEQHGNQRRPYPKVSHLKEGGGVRVPGIWEFVPYNYQLKHDLEEEFYKEVLSERSILLSTCKKHEKEAALGRLKKVYEEKFRSSRKRNEISIFLYSGPVYSRWKTEFMPPYLISDRGSILYSGDGFLDSINRVDRLTKFLQKKRMEKTGVFQVMHHGSKHNWFPGLASQIAPEFSVFSAGGITHPHREVTDDFKLHWPIHVRKGRSATFGGLLTAR
ncbi:hypothetical protein [Luteolibacter soli]|uniref:Metallo-beta-lactamase domain-containing protein n=1 Tax=Luteolibacter soli TaxID=3135280 RepID=A0ABU9AW22_9BACT